MKTDEKKILREFLETLFEPDDHLIISIIPEKGSGELGARESNLKRDKAIETLLDEKIYASKKRFVCFTPNPMKPKKTRSVDNVAILNTIFVDIDNAPLPKFAENAHYVFSRDDKHHHLYFLLERYAPTKPNLEVYKQMAKEIIEKCGGDIAVHDPARVLRVPYSIHRKNNIESSGYVLKKTKKLELATL